MRALYWEHYQGVAIEHFHRKLAKRHRDNLGSTTRLYLQKTGMVAPALQRAAHRRKLAGADGIATTSWAAAGSSLWSTG